MPKLYTIGFTKKNAQQFFETLRKNRVKKLVDIRINNTSQLAGFAKGQNLEYFINQILNIPYIHITDLAPTKELLSDYQNKKTDWINYEKIFRQLLKQRNIASKFDVNDFDNACFLCSEEKPDKCHRRLVTEFFKEKNPDVQIIHL